MSNTITQDGIDLVKQFEGLRLKPYFCPAHVLTIGYGHTGPDVVPGMMISEARAEKLLCDDLSNAGYAVSRYVTTPINDNQFTALASFVFNLGAGALHGSTLLAKLNAGDFAGAADQFLRWDHANGVVLEGLTRRRVAERELFLKEPTDEASV